MKIWIDEREALEYYISDQAVIFDCRGIMDNNTQSLEQFNQQHIQNSIFSFPILTGNNPMSNGRHPLPDLNEFHDFVTLHAQGRIIIAVDNKDGFFGTRFLYLCHLVGLDCYIIDGGYENLDGFSQYFMAETNVSSVNRVLMADENIDIDNKNLYYNQAIFIDIEALLKNDEERILIDARSKERFIGLFEPIDKVAGHIPEAINIPYSYCFEDGYIKDHAALTTLFQVTQDNPVTVYCGSGLSATPLYAALRSLDRDVALYAGSFSEWISFYPDKFETGD
ncbi:rhodanese-like domain-containing protein [Macrococcus caseolyticus]|uniref:sulfurtransferase n=1 Tax=Macrococcoides caseolyticum TaxID=69966 RepID=UPI0024BCCB80|nr:rhodanese-like domain-containing protein [Macrococcus caseolyticus]MDJ1153685.1 rhodanese-like domain-containing protein [Macrococcus caseolyticus]